jgi:hypothetical protein
MINLKHKGDLEIDGNIQITGGTINIDGNPIGGDEWTGGTQYILVKAGGTDIENAQELQDAYDLAVSLSASSINRITIVASPGNYNFSASTFTMDTEYIDLVSLDGNRSVVFNSTDNDGTISVETGNTLVKGIDVLTKSFKIGHNLTNLFVENCKGGDNSFGYLDNGVTLTLRGTFIDCVAGNNSFGHRPNIGGNSQINLNINGTFTNCTAGNNSFGYNTNNQVGSPTTLTFNFAKLTNCKAGNNSFGVHISPRAGSVTQFNFSEFTNCKSGVESFGYINNGNGTVQSTSNLTIFENCKAGNNSFCTGTLGTSNVVFKNCEGGNFSFFGDGTLTGKFENCVAELASFGSFGNASGTFTNCVGGDASFGNFGTASGTFTNCVGGNGSFGGDGTLSGQLYRCQLTDGTFQTVSGSGVTVLCIDGNNQINSQN